MPLCLCVSYVFRGLLDTKRRSGWPSESVFTDNQDRIVGTFLVPDDPEVIGVFHLIDSGVLDEDFSGGVVKLAHRERPGLLIMSVFMTAA